jgi:hypothetical protein
LRLRISNLFLHHVILNIGLSEKCHTTALTLEYLQ